MSSQTAGYLRWHLTCNEREQVEGSPNVHAGPFRARPEEAIICIPGKLDHALSHGICALLPHLGIILLADDTRNFSQRLLLKIEIGIEVRRLHWHPFIP